MNRGQTHLEHDRSLRNSIEFRAICSRVDRVHAHRERNGIDLSLAYPVELPEEGEAGDGEVGEGEVVDLLRGVAVGELGRHQLQERRVARTREPGRLLLVPHLRRSSP